MISEVLMQLMQQSL